MKCDTLMKYYLSISKIAPVCETNVTIMTQSLAFLTVSQGVPL